MTIDLTNQRETDWIAEGREDEYERVQAFADVFGGTLPPKAWRGLASEFDTPTAVLNASEEELCRAQYISDRRAAQIQALADQNDDS